MKKRGKIRKSKRINKSNLNYNQDNNLKKMTVNQRIFNSLSAMAERVQLQVL